MLYQQLSVPALPMRAGKRQLRRAASDRADAVLTHCSSHYISCNYGSHFLHHIQCGNAIADLLGGA